MTLWPFGPIGLPAFTACSRSSVRLLQSILQLVQLYVELVSQQVLNYPFDYGNMIIF